jgi:hypothetical protein
MSVNYFPDFHAIGDGFDVVDFPAMAGRLPVVGPAHECRAGIRPVAGITRDGLRLPPDGFDGGVVERFATVVGATISSH